MAYVDRSSNTRRTTTAIAVAVIQAGVIYAVATGLAVQFIDPPKKPDRTEATNIPLEPMPVPEDTKPAPPLPDPRMPHERDPLPHPSDSKPNPQPTGQATEATGPIGGSGAGDGDVIILDPPKPKPTFAAQIARPRNAPGSWATANDYPTRDIREGNQGVTRFRLSIDTDGKVLGCQVVGTSGFTGLDTATCQNVSRRARFEPAKDGFGNPVSGTYTGSIRWVLPD